MKLTLQRTSPAGRPMTFGKLLAGGQFVCYTLEDEVREIEGQPAADWKIKGATAIPSGEYRITLENSPRFGPNTLTVHNVPGFVGVRIHAGNTVADTEGCPLLGMAVNAHGIVGGTSGPAVKLVKQAVGDAIARGELVLMDVVNARALA
jgi:hypothetical protein